VNAPELRRTPDGDLILDHLAPAFVHVLHELPGLLDKDQPDAVKDRLYPLPRAEDDEANEEWRRLVHPDLFALVASAREVVTRDLATMGPSEDAPAPSLLTGWRLEIKKEHIPGWLSALNAARLALGTLYGLEEPDLNDDFVPEEWEERHVAIAKIHLLGWLQQLIIEDQHPPPEGFDPYPDSPDDDPDDA
jgi:hypothetical protein